MSYKVEVNTAGDPPDAWNSNLLRFESKEDADTYGVSLAMRWTAVKDFRVAESEDPVTHRMVPGDQPNTVKMVDIRNGVAG
jgi:hypothetical protein